MTKFNIVGLQVFDVIVSEISDVTEKMTQVKIGLWFNESWVAYIMHIHSSLSSLTLTVSTTTFLNTFSYYLLKINLESFHQLIVSIIILNK